MPLILARIDDRLIHGQVVQGWIPFLDINEVVVVSASITGDEMRKTLMRLSLPEEIALQFMSPADAAVYVKKLASETAKRSIILASSPKDALELLEQGATVDSINVGGMHYSAGKMQLGRAIFADNADLQNLKAIAAKGVKLEARGVPTDISLDIAEIIQN